jgi:hypothetical protein
MRGSNERTLKLDPREEALRGDDDQRIAGTASDVCAVQLALVDRAERRGLVRIADRVQRYL